MTLPSTPLTFGFFTARFDTNGTFTLEGEGWPPFKGTWTLDSAVIVLSTPGVRDCEAPGRYRVGRDGATIRFDSIERGRRDPRRRRRPCVQAHHHQLDGRPTDGYASVVRRRDVRADRVEPVCRWPEMNPKLARLRARASRERMERDILKNGYGQ